MTAYELADYLEKQYIHSQGVADAISMLRQQADRIAELENEIQECWCGGHSYAYLRAKNRLPQTKPLSDEEVFNLTAWKKNPYELYVEMEKEDMIAFARAIEERHGIK